MTTISELRHAALQGAEYLAREKGFSEVRFQSADIQSGEGVAVYYNLRDDFQAKLPYDTRHRNGLTGFWISGPDFIGSLWSALRAEDGREVRELKVIMAMSATFIEGKEDFASKYAQAFVNDLLARRDEVKNLLEAK